MKVKLYAKVKTENGFQVLEDRLGAVKVVFPTKVILITSDQKVTEYQQLELKEEKETKKRANK